MAKEYTIDEFLGKEESCSYADEVDKKISLLYDLCILCKRRKGSDNREEAVRELFLSYGSEIKMDNAVKGIRMENYTLDDLLKRKGYIQ